MRVAIAIAHPDDEVMWFSSLLLKKTEIWDCFVDQFYEPERTENFYRVCRRLSLIPHVGEPENYSIIVTHNEKGEYGHKKHIKVHKRTPGPKLVPAYPEGYPIDFEKKKELIQEYSDITKNGKIRWNQLLRYKNLGLEGFRFIR